MRLFGLIGYPLGHSFSRKYFTQKFSQEGIADAEYELFPIESINLLPALLKASPGLQGLNVTIPYKEQVLPYLDVPGIAAQIGACNCIHIKEGKLFGYNTDVVGFRESFVPGLRPGDTHALILGTGGASKAVAFALEQLGINYRYVSRKGVADGTQPISGSPQPRAVATQTGGGSIIPALSYESITQELLQTYSVLINCSPLGTYPNIDEAPQLPYEALSPRHYLYDLVYNPEVTRFLREGAQRGAVTRNGYDMLRLQAEESWKIWNS
jgi:shikimate dehydrogenase